VASFSITATWLHRRRTGATDHVLINNAITKPAMFSTYDGSLMKQSEQRHYFYLRVSAFEYRLDYRAGLVKALNTGEPKSHSE